MNHRKLANKISRFSISNFESSSHAGFDAGRPVIAGDGGGRRHTSGTGRFGDNTTGSERTSGKVLRARRRRARNSGQRPVFPVMMQICLALNQRGSIGMSRPFEYFTRRAHFYQAPVVHDSDTLGGLGY